MHVPRVWSDIYGWCSIVKFTHIVSLGGVNKDINYLRLSYKLKTNGVPISPIIPSLIV